METNINSKLCEEFSLNAKPGRIGGWAFLLLVGLSFAATAVLGVRPTEQLLSGAFAMFLVSLSAKMLWTMISLAGIRLEGSSLLVLKKRAGSMNFNLLTDVKEVSRFGADNGYEMVVVLCARGGKTFRLVTSQYDNTEKLRRLLADRLRLDKNERS
jgi:hypothetical protein